MHNQILGAQGVKLFLFTIYKETLVLELIHLTTVVIEELGLFTSTSHNKIAHFVATKGPLHLGEESEFLERPDIDFDDETNARSGEQLCTKT